MPDATATHLAGLRPWSMVIWLGVVSLAIDMVSDGAISVSGALLEELGASAVLTGFVTGAASAIALVLRLLTGPWPDRSGAYWTFTIAGYAMSAVSVPLLALTPVLGAASLAFASALLIIERTGKAVRAPAKTVLLADAAGAVGRGKGFGVHKLLDQIGAFAGPLVVAAVAATTGLLWPAFLVLVIPAVVAMVLLFRLRARVPDPSVYRQNAEAVGRDAPAGAAAPGEPNATAASGGRTSLAVPLLTACVPGLTLGRTIAIVVAGVLLWGLATGVQDSTVKALVADLIPAEQRGSAYGWFAVFQGFGAFAGATVAGVMYANLSALVGLVVLLQVVAGVLLILVLGRQRREQTWAG